MTNKNHRRYKLTTGMAFPDTAKAGLRIRRKGADPQGRISPRCTSFQLVMLMVESREDRRFTVDMKNLHRLAEGKPFPPSHIFRHRDLFQAFQSSPVIDQKGLINALHHIHFTNGTILVHASDPKYGEEFLLQARLDACTAEEIVCRWEETPPLPEDARLLHMIISDGLSLILLPIQLISHRVQRFTVAIPSQGHLLGKRAVRRHPCRGISACLTQNGFYASGELIDFSPLGFRVRLTPGADGSFIWLNEDNPCMIYLYEGQKTLFSGRCHCVRQTDDPCERELVLAPLDRAIQRFSKSKTRNRRMRVMPPPSIRFKHPLFRKPLQRDIRDLTVAGFAVDEPLKESVLLPGMIIPGLEIRYAGTLKMTCDAQVIYRRPAGKERVRCGLAILNMDFMTYTRLSHILAHSEDPRASFSSEVEMDALWEFFFDTGFIYPKKYHLLQSSREEFKQTYSRIYQENQEIATHFTYEENGRIYGHVSMIRAYQRTWMIHHLAARPLNRRRTGLAVLKNILGFSEGLFRYPSIKMDYMIFYFRPENRFPDFFFGGFTRHFGNPRGCSLDLFAYLNHPKDRAQDPLPKGWQLRSFEAHHLPELERFYRNVSGGLLLDILSLDGRNEEEESLEEVYRRKGFLRQCSIHALLSGESLKAVLIVNRSNLGINLSDLLNGIKVIVTDPAGLPWEVLNTALAELTPVYPTDTVPLMIYPASYPDEKAVPVAKRYLLWIVATQHGKTLREYLEKNTQMSLRFIFKHLLRKLVAK